MSTNKYNKLDLEANIDISCSTKFKRCCFVLSILIIPGLLVSLGGITGYLLEPKFPSYLRWIIGICINILLLLALIVGLIVLAWILHGIELVIRWIFYCQSDHIIFNRPSIDESHI